MRIMLNNDFHFKHAWFEVAGLPATLTVNQARRARRLLCGRKGLRLRGRPRDAVHRWRKAERVPHHHTWGTANLVHRRV